MIRFFRFLKKCLAISFCLLCVGITAFFIGMTVPRPFLIRSATITDVHDHPRTDTSCTVTIETRRETSCFYAGDHTPILSWLVFPQPRTRLQPGQHIVAILSPNVIYEEPQRHDRCYAVFLL